ncbi:HvfC/BufC N-terminal domain-containing protein [Sapientia aquatica]|nr:DNA-binding domain-containing protein [Sapientia aquatica]
MRADLSLLQHDFAAALVNVEMVQPALAMFKGDPALNIERFAQYRGSIISLWQQTLSNAFPVLRQLLGDDFFDNVARVFGEKHPSQSGNLAEFGQQLPRFIEELDSCRPYPYLGDVARLEWLVHQAHYLQHRAPATLADLVNFPPERLADVRITLQPCCSLLTSDWAVADIWHAHQDSPVTLPHELSKPSACLVWRADWQTNWHVQVSELTRANYAALSSLASGKNLGHALEAAMELDPEFDVQTALADWFTKQIFSNLALPHLTVIS